MVRLLFLSSVAFGTVSLANVCAEPINEQNKVSGSATESVSRKHPDQPSVLDERLRDEDTTKRTRFALTPHKPNYMVVSYNDKPNTGSDALDPWELKFQVSFKVDVIEDLWGGDLVFGYTQQSFWQAFNSEISSPFRETNYEPEIMWVHTRPYKPSKALARQVIVGFSHQSNGRSQPSSRSWNRLYVNLIWEYHDFYFSFKPWYRIPERDKVNANDPGGDDNPDIDRYMGSFELTAIWVRGDQRRLGLMLRNNLNFGDNLGAVQIDWSFPIKSKLKGYVQYFNGYGDSLIDYNHAVSRLSVGLMLNNWL